MNTLSLTGLATRLAAVASSLLLACSPALAAAPASPDALEKVFAAQKVPATMQDMMATLEAQHAQTVAQVSDPEERARKQATHDKLAAFLREKFAWQNLQPMAIEAYQTVLTDADAAALLAYYETPAGDVTLRVLQPATLKIAKGMMQYVDERLDVLIEQVDAKRPPAKTSAKPWQPSNAHERAAAQLATLLMKPRYDGHLQQLEARMAQNMKLMLPASRHKGIKTEVAAYAKAIRRDLGFPSVLPMIVGHLVDELSEEELTLVLQSERSPARRQLRAKLDKADEAWQKRLNLWLSTHVMREMFALILSKPEAGKAPAAD